jgi:nuclear pore complex protein Nup155
MTGPEEMNRVASINEQVALQAEHRILDAEVKTIANTIEGIAFLIQLFEQPVDEIFLSLPEEARQRFKLLSYEGLFTTTEGKELAKELVKAIVNRSIAAGSNVDTVADSLRRRCGSFCSADDVVIFKAQEQLQKAFEAGAESANGRTLLNESLKLFMKVASSLTADYLEAAVNQYLALSFFAGAIQLCLSVAQQRDRGNRALAWIKDDRPSPDSRSNIYDRRVSCYAHIWRVIEAVDATAPAPTDQEAVAANITRRKQEAYNVIDASEDEVFQTSLYDWYLQRGWSDRLLELNSPFVIAYLERKSVGEPGAADLLWRYHTHRQHYFEGAKVQLTLATSGFPLDLPARIDYLSRAKANASTRVPTFGRLNNSRQEVLQQINDQLDNANVQLEVLRRLEDDQRLLQNQERDKVLEKLNGRVMSLDEVCLIASKMDVTNKKCQSCSITMCLPQAITTFALSFTI